jgi:hypothetical protein
MGIVATCNAGAAANPTPELPRRPRRPGTTQHHGSGRKPLNGLNNRSNSTSRVIHPSLRTVNALRCHRLVPIIDHAAQTDRLSVLGYELIRQRQEAEDAIVGDSVINQTALASRRDESAPAEARQMARESALERSGQVDKLSHGALALR